MDKHGEGYIGTDDAMPDSFDEWLCHLEPDEWINYAEEWKAIKEDEPIKFSKKFMKKLWNKKITQARHFNNPHRG